jgi:16S rRNA processing protein RimM
VYVVPISDDPHRFEPGSRLLRGSDDTLTIERSRPHHGRLLVKFTEVDSRDEAELLRGPLYVTPDDLRDLDEAEFWAHDLVGCSVVTSDGAEVGRVVGVMGGPAQDLLEVETERGLRYVPAVKEIVVSVDIGREVVTIDPPPGLVD